MDNKEYLEEIKKAVELEKQIAIKGRTIDEHNKILAIEPRMAKAMEIIAEELINTRDFLTGLSTLYKDLIIDVEKLKEGK